MTPAYHVKLYKDRLGKWRSRLVARNGQVVATCHQGYSKLSHCQRMAYKIWAAVVSSQGKV